MTDTQGAQAEPFNANTFAKSLIEGVGGMNDYEKYELVIWHESERVCAAIWTLRCLGNPRCEDTDRVLEAIMERRRENGAVDPVSEQFFAGEYASDLLEALEALNERLTFFDENYKLSDIHNCEAPEVEAGEPGTFAEAWDRARAAIARARGEK